jgi:hypothetical protein
MREEHGVTALVSLGREASRGIGLREHHAGFGFSRHLSHERSELIREVLELTF